MSSAVSGMGELPTHCCLNSLARGCQEKTDIVLGSVCLHHTGSLMLYTYCNIYYNSSLKKYLN